MIFHLPFHSSTPRQVQFIPQHSSRNIGNHLLSINFHFVNQLKQSAFVLLLDHSRIMIDLNEKMDDQL